MLRTGLNEEAHAAKTCALPFRVAATVRDRPDTRPLTVHTTVSDREIPENGRSPAVRADLVISVCRSALRLPDGRDGSRREEVRIGLLEPLAGDEDVHGFVVERDQAGDGQQLAGREVVGPREILVDRVADAD